MPDSFSSLDISKSVNQLCRTLSINNIIVPRIDNFSDVFDFIKEYESVTATLPDESQTALLVKAFPPGRYKSWFEKTLKPLIDKKETWKTIKQSIIQRYSDVEDRDRHFKRLQEMTFVDDGHNKLYDHVEDLLISLEKAMPDLKDDETKIRYVKSTRLPSAVQQDLRRIGDYNKATTIEQFMKGIREYDRLKLGSQNQDKDKGEKVTSSEMVNLLKEIVKGIKQEAETTRNIVAALRPRSRDSSPGRPSQQHNHYLNPYPYQPRYQQPYPREASPRRYDQTNQQRNLSPFNSPLPPRASSPAQQSVERRNQNPINYPQGSQQQSRYNSQQYGSSVPYGPTNILSYARQGGRSPTPPPSRPYQSNQMQDERDGSQGRPLLAVGYQQVPNTSNQAQKAFSDELYYQRFGVPTSPCRYCGFLHFHRHCQNHLN